MTVVIFPDSATASAALNEIGATPDIEGGIGPVLVGTPATYAVAADGRCAIAHPFNPIDEDWLRAYLSSWPGVSVGDELPADWAWPGTP